MICYSEFQAWAVLVSGILIGIIIKDLIKDVIRELKNGKRKAKGR